MGTSAGILVSKDSREVSCKLIRTPNLTLAQQSSVQSVRYYQVIWQNFSLLQQSAKYMISFPRWSLKKSNREAISGCKTSDQRNRPLWYALLPVKETKDGAHGTLRIGVRTFGFRSTRSKTFVLDLAWYHGQEPLGTVLRKNDM